MPKGNGNTIVAVPEADQPYAPCVKEVPDGPGLAPVSLEIELRRGVWIEGKITDKTTGKPVTGFVEYFAHSKNPSLAEYPDFDGSVFSHHHPVREDGSYRIAGLPGPGLVAVLRRDYYLSAPERDDEFGTKQQGLSTAPYHLGFTSNYSALAEVDPPKGSDSLHRDITLDPGSTFPGIVLGPDGKPMTGARSWAVDSLEPMKTAEFTVSGMNPKEPPRDLVFLHPERGLVGIRGPPRRRGPWSPCGCGPERWRPGDWSIHKESRARGCRCGWPIGRPIRQSGGAIRTDLSRPTPKADSRSRPSSPSTRSSSEKGRSTTGPPSVVRFARGAHRPRGYPDRSGQGRTDRRDGDGTQTVGQAQTHPGAQAGGRADYRADRRPGGPADSGGHGSGRLDLQGEGRRPDSLAGGRAAGRAALGGVPAPRGGQGEALRQGGDRSPGPVPPGRTRCREGRHALDRRDPRSPTRPWTS